MATIPPGQKFHTIAADVDTMNRGSASANADRSIFTMADIVESIPSGLSGSGTAGKVSRFTASDTIADSLIGDDGTTVSLGTDITIGDSIKFSEDSTSKFGFFAGQDNFFIYNEGSLQFECNNTTTTLYHSGAYKLYTTADGVTVSGQVNSQALHVTGTDAPSGTAKGPLNVAFGAAPTASSFGTVGDIIVDPLAINVCTVTGADPTPATWLKTDLSATGGLSGSGTANTVPMWSDSSTLTDSVITQDLNGIVIPKRISHLTDLDTYIEFQTGKFIIKSGNYQTAEFDQQKAQLFHNNDWRLRTDADGITVAGQVNVNALNTAPSSATDTGSLGEIRWAADYVYLCTATNVWVRASLATWV
jgi:hypothetical protein